MQVNLTNFPDPGNLPIRRSLNLGVDKPIINNGATGLIENASNTAESSMNKASSAAEAADGNVQNHLDTLLNKFRRNLPEYYSIGLWGYCQKSGDYLSCSEPSVSFAFDLSAILGTISSDLDNLLPGINEKALTGYHQALHAIVWLYIFAFILTVLSGIFAVRTEFFSGGSTLLVVSCIVCTKDQVVLHFGY